MTTTQIAELLKECRRQEESCLYTASALHIWLKRARLWRGGFLIAPIILGGVAGSQLFLNSGNTGLTYMAVFCSLAAGFFPAIHLALNLDMGLFELRRSASEYTNLRDRFRIAANVKSQTTLQEFQTECEALMDRLDAVRRSSPAVPEWCFKKAQKKIQSGDYRFDSDERKTKGIKP